MRSTVYIVGAGFSKHAGLPLQKDFTEALILPREERSHPSRPLIKHLDRFINKAFDHNKIAKARFWPNLEDIFTNIDLAANTGHHLGPHHSPSNLRMTRRVLLARMMLMLDECYTAPESRRTTEWKTLEDFLRAIDLSNSAFISLNWDTVIERRLAELRHVDKFIYGCGAKAAQFADHGDLISPRDLRDDATAVSVIKIHGSVNWLYCDNCRQLYWFPPENAVQVAMQLVTGEEAENLKLKDSEGCEKWHCMNCPDVPLTTRIATFSFLKALDFPMFERSWISAERLLRNADKWVFIGYSLPAADFEFKHLLKRVQLSRYPRPEFVVITRDSKENPNSTYDNYQKFFGRDIRKGENVFPEGLSQEAIEAAR